MSDSTYYVYILTNPRHTVLYTGVTNNLARRLTEHLESKPSDFANRFNCTKLVFVEEFMDAREALRAEKSIKKGTRARKIRLIESLNPGWKDLSGSLS